MSKQTSEYQVIQSNNPAHLQTELVRMATQGWRPILLTSAGVSTGVVTTVILEHVLGS
jgi:hypothetical protein